MLLLLYWMLCKLNSVRVNVAFICFRCLCDIPVDETLKRRNNVRPNDESPAEQKVQEGSRLTVAN